MSILIKRLFGKDMPMPQEGFVDIRIHFKSGKLRYVTMQTGEHPFYATFEVEKLPPHGRLIDADAVNKAMDERIKKLKDDRSIYEASCVSTALDMFAPTVIEAEGSETDGRD